VYCDILEHVLTFVQNLSQQEGLWREHLVLLENIYEVVHLFYLPQIHTELVPTLMEFVLDGNTEVRKQSAKCLAKVLARQHHVPAKEELIDFIITRLFQSQNFGHRRTFIQFCCFVVDLIPF